MERLKLYPESWGSGSETCFSEYDKKMLTKFSIIIVTHNGLHDLRECVSSLLPQLTPNWEILVVDNGSTDGTKEFLNSLSSDSVRYVPLGANTGFAAGNNSGAKLARGQWIFLLNNDTICEAGALRALEESEHKLPQFRIFACRMVRLHDKKIDNMGIHFSRLLRGVQIGSGSQDGWTAPREVFGASGGAMLVHRSVIEDIGLFDPQFFAYQEDVDFAVRARLAGYGCLYLPEAAVYHKGGGTSSSNPTLYRYFNQRNMELVLRNIPRNLRWKYGLGHFVYTIYQVFKWTLKGDGLTVVKAKLDAVSLGRKWDTEHLRIRVKPKEFERFLKGRFSSEATPPTEAAKFLLAD